ncbi:exosortase/archaeosortase family protein [Anaerobaca lacustris]|uniref:Exosortase/archaeosortase family protein n=1 Tax=Anaerobaca lacustris TaxID=3044600 RepID=A0AAW6U1F2_9BACT|nr:exosortase/archaeosortase family protein [Sedimentisphaerales bacterium M17dextr]
MYRNAANHSISRRRISSLDIDAAWRVPSYTSIVIAILALVALTTWSYWPTLVSLFNAWQRNEDYSAGQLVPLVAVFFLWRNREGLKDCTLAACWWAGLPLLILSQVFRMHGFFTYRLSAERYSIVLTVGAWVLMVAGWQVLRRVVWILLFLFLMFPLPGRLHSGVSDPLQRLATTGSVFLLEAFGVPADQQGNIVMLNDNIPMAVAEACSGLRMLTAFVIVTAFIAYMVKRPRWQKAVLLAASIPVAVVANMIRIVATGVIMLHVSVEIGEKFFHDFAGLVMMPAAVSLLFGLLALMDVLVTVPQADGQAKTTVVRARRKPNRQNRAQHNGRKRREFSA